tara:strand:+ start:1312 stop:2157 length:846 start_codon:yes stop_codon:yes gene_type:complete
MNVEMKSISEAYTKNGFVFPIDAVTEEEAKSIRADLEKAETECINHPEKLALLRSYPDRLIPSFDQLVRNENLIEAVKPMLGSDLMVWSAGLFIKEAKTDKIVTWHQDLTYWGLNDAEEVTAWVALSPSNVNSGCMRFVPGSQKKRLVTHRDTFDDKNLLSRGQEITVKVDDSDGVDVVLNTGQASLHHGHLFHSSGPNSTEDRRIGSAIRYIKTSMKQNTGDKSLVAHVSGEDRYKNFTVAEGPKGWLHEEDFEACRRDAEIKKRILYQGAKSSKGKRYR